MSKVRFAYFLCGFLLCLSVLAQQQPFISALDRIAKKENIDFAFDADLLEGLNAPLYVNSLLTLTEFISKSSALKLEQATTNTYLIAPRPTVFEFTFPKQETSFHLAVLNKNQEILSQQIVSQEQSISFLWTPASNDTLHIISTVHEAVQLSTAQLLFHVQLELPLREKMTYLDEVVVRDYLTSGISLNLANQTTSINIEDMAFTPGETDGDVLASIATLPGVNTPDERPGNIFIHNSPADQNILLYNKIPIYHQGHYFGSISPYNPAVVKEVTVYKNGFRPSMGDKVGGAIEIKSSNQLSDYEAIGASINTLYGTFHLKRRLGQKIGVSVAARHSVPSSWISPKLDSITRVVYDGTVIAYNAPGTTKDSEVNFGDYNVNLLLQPNNKNSFALHSVYTTNHMQYESDTSTTTTTESIGFDNYGANLQWLSSFSNSRSGTLNVTFGQFENAFASEGLDRLGNETVSNELAINDIQDVSVSYELRSTSENRNEISFGTENKWTRLAYTYVSELPNSERQVATVAQKKVYLNNTFLNYHMRSHEKWRLQAGVRSSYYDELQKLYVSPRFFANYDLPKGWTAKACAGRYFQFLSQVKYMQYGSGGFYNELWRLADQEEVSVLSSNQYMLGVIWDHGKLVMDVELYRKQIHNVNYSNTLYLETETKLHTADWSIFGLDLFAKYQATDRLLLWGSYEYSEGHLAFDSLSSVEYPHKYIRPHQAKLGALFSKNRWKFSSFLRVASGLSGRSYDIMAIISDWEVPDRPGPHEGGGPPENPPPGGNLGNRPVPNTILQDIPERFATYKSFDLYITYEIPKTNTRKWEAKFGLSLINVLNVRNEIDAIVRGDENQIVLDRHGTGFAPNLNISISW